MAYHPIMGIALFAATVGLAYVLGRHWASRRASPVPATQPRIRTAAEAESSEGDAQAPDAPWVGKS